MAFTDHLSETEGQLERLNTVFEIIGRPAKGQKCPAIDGILKEAKDLMEEFEGDAALDAALACAAQKVEHYEITSYGSLCAFAEQLGLDDVCDELEAILDEEKAADKKLSRLAETVLNIEADEASDEDADEKPKHKSRSTTASTKSKAAVEDREEDEEAEEDSDDEAAGTSTVTVGGKSRSEKEIAEVH
jgi:ferritin-like metal-binding protein YciE